MRVGRRRSTEQAPRLAKRLPQLLFTPSLKENVITNTRETAALQASRRAPRTHSVKTMLLKVQLYCKWKGSQNHCSDEIKLSPPLLPALYSGFDILLVDVDMLLEKVPSILSQWNAETMGSQAGELSGGCRAIEPARNCTQCSQRSRMDTVPSLPNTLFSLHLLLLNYLASSAPTKKS